MEPPSWLDLVYLYRLNYGPAFAEDVHRACQSIFVDNITDSKSASIVLLDGRIGQKVHRALYEASNMQYRVYNDFNESSILYERNDYRIMPFDHDRRNDESDALIQLETFTIARVWGRPYSFAVLGIDSRPPLPAVAMDMIKMVEYLLSLFH